VPGLGTHAASCPLCSSRKIKRVFSQPEWAINRCKACTNAWTVPSPGQVEYEAADFHASATHSHDLASPTTVDDLPEEWKQCVRGQAKLLVRHLPQRARVLEIGCGEGILLAELATVGFDVHGIEPSESGSARARRKGLNVLTGYFPHTKPDGYFDAVILSHVLEHLSDPMEILGSISKVVPQGYLLLVQTNYKGLVPRWDKENWYAWAPQEHFWHFTPRGLGVIAGPLGYYPVACEYSSLVHGARRVAKLAVRASAIFPAALDQCHLLLKLKNDPTIP